jgi:putative ABC transport system ATP-binding protein
MTVATAGSAPATTSSALRPDRSDAEEIISAVDVHKTFRTGKVEVHALRGVSLSVRRGEMVAVMGTSGCGKTTLLNCLSGLDEFDSGEIRIEGTSLRDMNDRRRTAYRAERMGFVFQTFNLLPVLTALENVELPLLVSGVRSSEARRRALDALDSVGLSDRTHHRPAELSGGQRQRVTIARALVNSPAIVWADEPTGNLDSKASADVLGLMRVLNRERSQTLMIVTHDAQIGATCDRIIRMEDGEIISHDVAADEAASAGAGAAANAGADAATDAATKAAMLAASGAPLEGTPAAPDSPDDAPFRRPA